MDYAQNLLQAARGINLLQMMEEEILKKSDQIVAGVRAQWKEGVRPDGTIIGTYKSFAYRSEKIAMNPAAGGNVDLILTGDLNRNLTVNKLKEGFFTVFSTDDKAVGIAQKYGLDVYGLNDEELDAVLDQAAYNALEAAMDIIYG